MKIDIGGNLNKLSKLLKNRLSQIEIHLRWTQNLINLKTSIQLSNLKKIPHFSKIVTVLNLMCPTIEPQRTINNNSLLRNSNWAFKFNSKVLQQ